MQEQDPEFSELLARLHAAKVRYVLIGGLAMILHGSAHVTQDIDISYARDPENYEALSNVLKSIHARLRNAPPDLPFLLDSQTFRNTQNLTLETEFGSFDLLGQISGISSFDELYKGSTETLIDDVPVRIASLDDLIKMKRAANRPKDQNHLMELEAMRKIIEQEGKR